MLRKLWEICNTPFWLALFALGPMILCGLGCASTDERLPLEGNIHPSALVTDSMTVHTPRPQRPNPKPWVFYYKTCETSGRGSFFSKTSYTCTDPYY